jgi:hypothetical protein
VRRERIQPKPPATVTAAPIGASTRGFTIKPSSKTAIPIAKLIGQTLALGDDSLLPTDIRLGSFRSDGESGERSREPRVAVGKESRSAGRRLSFSSRASSVSSAGREANETSNGVVVNACDEASRTASDCVELNRKPQQHDPA